jgi:hypothetical protein
MKIFRFILVFQYFSLSVCCHRLMQISHRDQLVNAVKEIIDYSYEANSVQTVNVISSECSESFRHKYWRNEMMKELSVNPKVSFRHGFKLVQLAKDRKNRFTVLVVTNFSEFLSIHEKLTSAIFKFNGIFLIVLVDEDVSEVQRIFDLMWKKQIFNVDIIYEEKMGHVRVETFMPFSDNKCGDTTPIIIDYYANGKFMNNSKNFFPRKLNNLHNCPIRLATSDSSLPHVFVRILPNTTRILYGENIDIIETLSKMLNFKINFSYIGSEGNFYENGTGRGPLTALLKRQADLSVNNWYLKINRLKIFDATISYVSEQVAMMIPPGRELTTFEKLTFEFTLTLWAFISLCFVIGFLVIVIIKRQPLIVQNLVYGTNVRSPITNLFAVFIGQNQTQLPRGDFARILIAVFMLYSIVIRTVYEGAYYEILKSNQQQKPVKSLDEMVRRDFKFYTSSGLDDGFDQMSAIKGR